MQNLSARSSLTDVISSSISKGFYFYIDYVSFRTTENIHQIVHTAKTEKYISKLALYKVINIYLYKARREYFRK